MSNKTDITQRVLSTLGTTEWTFDLALSRWWANVRITGGLRLSAVGYGVFRDLARIPHYEFDVRQDLLAPGNLILLDRRMTCAYSLTRSRGQSYSCITLFDSREAMLLTLYGDISLWLENLRNPQGQ